MTYLGLAVLLAVVGLFGFIWYRQRAAPGPGIVLGEYEVIGCYAGQKIHTRLKGMMVDATSFFCASDLTEPFKDLLYEDIDRMIPKPAAEKKPETGTEKGDVPEKMDRSNPTQTAERTMLEKIKKQIKEFPLDTVCKVAIIRNGVLGEKHLIMTFSDDKNRGLSDYSSNEEESHFTFAFGPVNKGLIKGCMQTLTEPWEFSNERFPLGDFPVGTVHVFVPDDPMSNGNGQSKANGKSEKSAWNLNAAKLILHVPNVVHINEHMKSIMQQLKDKDFALQQMGVKYSALATETDVLRRAVKGFMTEGQKIEDLMPKKLDVLDFIMLMAFPTICYVVAAAFGVYPLAGVIAGLSIAGFIIYWRR